MTFRADADAMVEALRSRGLVVATGTFGARMAVHLVNDGPVTLLLDTRVLETPSHPRERSHPT